MPTRSTPAVPAPALVALCNAVPNVFWSVLCLMPLSIFCYQHVARPWLYGLLGVSLLGYLVPVRWFQWWQLSQSPGLYQRLGVPIVNRFTQHGDLVNGLLRRRYPQYQRVRARRSAEALMRSTYHMERFHMVLFVFFLLISLYALGRGYGGWAGLLLLLNGGYNLYPIWLQQYLRVRLRGSSMPFRGGLPSRNSS